jgi:hypothetical protein
MKIDLKNLTFTIPVRIDSEDRAFNLNYIIEYLLHNFDTNIIVYENGPNPVFKNKYNVTHVYEQNEGVFHRTHYLNNMAKQTTTDFIANYDCDVIFPVKQVVKAYNLLINSSLDCVYPYSGYFVNIKRDVLNEIVDLDPVNLNPDIYQNFGKNSFGGAVFWYKKAFIEGGMENENCISWGCEDWERLKRFETLGYKIGRVNGPLYHIDHVRSQDSSEANPFYNNNRKEFDKILNSKKENLLNYIKTWPWVKS